MRLVSFRITNFRSIQDSGDVEVGDSLCLVGKNEAGKTALLHALTTLNPHPSTPISLDVERDFPRQHLTEFQRNPKKAESTVVTSRWELREADRQALESEFGSGSVRPRPITLVRKYDSPDLDWSFDFDFAAAVNHLISQAGLSEFEVTPLKGADTTTKLVETLAALEKPTKAQSELLTKMQAYPDKSMTGFAKNLLKTRVPRFMYFSHYDRMDGQLRVDNFAARKAGQVGPKVEPGEQVFVDFLEYAGTSLAEITKSSTFESLNARCEAASIRITQQLQQYWSQNPFLKIDVRVGRAEPGDKAPFNEGIVARARVRNDLYGMSVPFSERSAGFVWFFSFIVKFAQVTGEGGPLVILLDEPGLTLHGRAQGELLMYFENEIEPLHQLLFTTHSPFMVPAEDFASIRIVEDRVHTPKPGKWVSEGTKVRSDALAVDRDTLFPLQGALGYEVTQALFVGKNTLLVEGPGDILFLKALSSALTRHGRRGLSSKWTLCPAGGLDKVQPFVSLFSSAQLNIVVLTDFAKSDRKKLENLLRSQVLQADRVLTFASLLEVEEADVEDIFAPEIYVRLLNEAYSLAQDRILTAESLDQADTSTTRLVKKAEAAFRLMPPSILEFNHYAPAEWLLTHPAILDGVSEEVKWTLDRAEKVFDSITKVPIESK